MPKKLGRIPQTFLEEFKKLNITPLPDEELHKLLVKAIKEQDLEARNKVMLHILPIIINKSKKIFKENYLVETMDFLQEVCCLVLDSLFKNFRIDEQEPNRCALFFRALNYYFLCALSRLKKNYLSTREEDPDYKEIFCGDIEDLETIDLDFNELIEEKVFDTEIDDIFYLSEYSISQSFNEKKDFLGENFEKLIYTNFNKLGIGISVYLDRFEGKLNWSNRLKEKFEKFLLNWIKNNQKNLKEV